MRASASFFCASVGAAAAEGVEAGGEVTSEAVKASRRETEGEEVAGSTLKVSAMQLTATSMDSASSGVRVPSVVDLVRKSQIARARRCLGVAWSLC